MNDSDRSERPLPTWARVADGLALLLALAVLSWGVFGEIRIGTLFSMSTPWRALFGLIVVVGLRHCLVRAHPLHRRIRSRLRRAGGRRPRSARPESAAGGRLAALHIAGLWSLAVAQPIFDLVGRSPEFFVAHDTQPGYLPGLVLLLCLGGPAACLLVVRLVGLVVVPHQRRRVAESVVGGLVGVIVLLTLKSLGGSPGGFVVSSAAAAVVGAAHVYRRFATARLFATFLTPAAVVVPAVFLLSPGVGRLLVPAEESRAFDLPAFAAAPPVVVVVFDQLQLAALLDREGHIDREAFPHFAALADRATWFRNTTAVGEYTRYALPAILTGRYPSQDRLPVVADHPGNLFTLLGGRYRLHVEEPLSELCPESLCPPDHGFGAWLAGVLRDLAIVYLTVVLPDDMTRSLPPVDQNWNDFAGDPTFQDRWRVARLDDRRRAFTGFIESVGAADEPTLHFAHVLLPHEPWLYLPTGQQFTFMRENVGLRNGRWSDDPWAAVLNSQRYLLQVGYVDTLLGRLAARLRETGVYDDALIIVTADHGASLQPGQSFRRPAPSTFADVGQVPFLVKRPGQREGEVVDAEVEVVDVLPTLAAVLGVELPWAVDGVNAFDPAPSRRLSRKFFFDGARNIAEAPGDLAATLIERASRKFEWFATGDPLDVRAFHGRYGELIGRAADPLRVARPSDLQVVVDTLPLLRDVDPGADFVPAHITGSVAEIEDDEVPPALAIALNGIVAAVTRPYGFPVRGRRNVWEAIVDPKRFVVGANSLDVFEIRAEPDGGPVELAVASGSAAPRSWPNLVREAEIQVLGARVSGFSDTEWNRLGPFRWTRGDARLRVPLDPRSPPTELAVDVLMTGPPKRLVITADGCVLFDQTVQGRWSAAFGLGDCRLRPPDIEIALQSDTHVPSARDTRELGVAVSSIELRGPSPVP